MGIIIGVGGIGKSDKNKFGGVGTIPGGVYQKLDIEGVYTIEGDIKADELNIDGVCTCNGNVEAELFECDGVLTISGNLRAGKADVDGVVTVNGNKIEADRIDCDGLLSVDGEISADVIDADGKLNAKEIVGDRIRIKSYWKRGLAALIFKIGEKNSKSMKFSVVDLIEGTTVELRGVRAKSVNGQNVTIEKNCSIDRVSASGELSINPKSIVGEVVNA